MSRKMCCLFLTMIATMLIAAGMAIAQQPPSPSPPKQDVPSKKDISYYRLDFVLRELEDGKAINSRNYSMWVKTGRPENNLRVGNDIPVPSIPTQDKPAGLTYRYVGVQIDCVLDEIEGSPAITMSGSISAVLPPEQAHDIKSALPVIRTMTFRSAAILSTGKPTMISSVDDPSSKRRFQLEVMATKLK